MGKIQIIGKLIKNKGVNVFLFEVLKQIKEEYDVSYDDALLILLWKVKQDNLTEEEKELLNKFKQYRTIKLKNQLDKEINLYVRNQQKSRDLKVLIKKEIRRLKNKGLNNEEIRTALANYFLNPIYLNHYNYNKQKVEDLLNSTLFEELGIFFNENYGRIIKEGDKDAEE